MAWVQIYGGTPVGGGAQNLTPTRVVNTNTFGAATVGRGAVGLFPSLLFDATVGLRWGADDLYWSSQGLAWGSGDTFQAHTVTTTYALTATRVVDGDAFGAATVTRGAVSLLPTRYTDPDSFGSHTVANVGGGTQSLTATRYTNSSTFGAATVTRGAVNLAPTRVVDGDAFGAAVVSRGAVALTTTRYTDPDAFGAATITQGALLQPTRLVNVSTFGSHTLSQGEPPAGAERYPKPAGRPRRRYVVEVDGEDFIVESVEEAQALLAQAVETAEEVAPAVVRKYRRIAAKRKAAETRVPVPVVRVTDNADAALRSLVERMQRDIEAAYERAARDEELRLYLAARAREIDEEEAAMLLL